MPREKAFRSLYKTVTSVLRIDFSLETHDFVLDKIPQILVYTGVLKKKKTLPFVETALGQEPMLSQDSTEET